MSPRMRPSTTRKSMPSSAMVVPKDLRRPRASMTVMASALLLGGIRLGGFRRCGMRRRPAGRPVQEFFRLQAEPLNGGVDPGPLFAEKLLPFALQQQIARARVDEHAATSLALDQLLVHQLLIALQNRERIDPKFGRDIAHGWQRIAFLQHSVEYHRYHTVAKLAINRLTVVPLTIHQVFHLDLSRDTAPEILRRAKALLRMTPAGSDARKTASVGPVQVEVRVDRLVLHHECPILAVMVGVDDGEHRMVHVLLRAPADVL